MFIIKMTPNGVVQSLQSQNCGKDRAEVKGGPEARQKLCVSRQEDKKLRDWR